VFNIGLILSLRAVAPCFSKTVQWSQKSYFPGAFIFMVEDKNLGLSGSKSLDSLLKLKNDTAVIGYTRQGDVSFSEGYVRLFKDDKGWQFEVSDGKSFGIGPAPG
jgi:hypothetical protein